MKKKEPKKELSEKFFTKKTDVVVVQRTLYTGGGRTPAFAGFGTTSAVEWLEQVRTCQFSLQHELHDTCRSLPGSHR